MSFDDQQQWATLARQALAELNADELDPSPAVLMGGPLAWGDSWIALMEAERDPANAPTMRPHVISPCQKLQSHPALRLRCSCGRGLDFLALASMPPGVIVVSSPRRLPKKLRRGGPNDLASVIEGADPQAGWALIPWEQSMRDRFATHRSSWQDGGEHFVLGEGAVLIGDAAKRQTFTCGACSANFTFVNVNLLRLVLETMANGDREVRLGGRPAAVPSER